MKNRYGFTLLEILISVTIVAIITGVVYETFFSVTDVSEKLRVSGNGDYQAVMFTSLLKKDIESVYCFNPQNKPKKNKSNTKAESKFYFVCRAVDAENVDEDKPFLKFFSASSIYSKNKPIFNINLISYFIKKTNKDEQLSPKFSIMREESVYMEGLKKTKNSAVEVLDDISNFKMYCIDKNGDKVDEYDTRKHKNRLPVALDFYIQLGSGESKKDFHRIVLLPDR